MIPGSGKGKGSSDEGSQSFQKVGECHRGWDRVTIRLVRSSCVFFFPKETGEGQVSLVDRKICYTRLNLDVFGG